MFFMMISFIFLTKLHSQNLQVSVTDSNKKIATIITNENNSKKDTLELKKHLAFLKQSSSKRFHVLYDALLANGYSNFFDKINNRSNYYYLKSIQEAQKLNDPSLLVWTQLNYSKYLYFYCEIDKLIPIALKTIENTKKVDASEIILPEETFKFFGWMMFTVEDNSAIYFLKKSLQYSKKVSSESASVLNAIGNCYFNRKDLSNAMYYFNKSEAISLKIGDSIRYAKILGDKALVYENKGNIKEAISLLKKDIYYSQKFKEYKNEMFASIILAKILLKSKAVNEAKIILERAERIANSKPYYKSSLKEIIELKLHILNNQNPNEELILRRQLNLIEDTLLKTNGKTVLRRSNWLIQKMKYENEAKKNQLELQHEEKMKNIYILIVVFAILLSLFIYISSRKRLKIKKLRVMEYENDRIIFEKKLKDANFDLSTYIEYLRNKNKQISILKAELDESKNSALKHLKEEEKDKLQEILDSHLMTDENWNAFKREFKKLHTPFYESLIGSFPELKESNLKIIMLQKLDFTNQEMASLLGVTVDAIKKNKQRLKKKLGDKYDLLFEIIELR
ncbi:hypothetical protein ACMDB5_02170 [Flavobacterium sp. W1B]|uniref:tetratricopeptide repeat protein n=1 Tax=Flavobacterium sp. W1B TaxID=3394146 RepID=UPI0039BCCE62